MKDVIYHVFPEKLQSPDIGTYVTYGIAVKTPTQGKQVIHDISTYRGFVEEMAELFTRAGLSPVHFDEATEDFVNLRQMI